MSEAKLGSVNSQKSVVIGRTKMRKFPKQSQSEVTDPKEALNSQAEIEGLGLMMGVNEKSRDLGMDRLDEGKKIEGERE